MIREKQRTRSVCGTVQFDQSNRCVCLLLIHVYLLDAEECYREK